MELEELREKISLPNAAKNLQKYFKRIEEKFDNYEERQSQKSMIRAIVKAFQLGEHAMIEAPTGTGKSLAYLLAFLSIWEQFENKVEDGELVERKPNLCIATNTIALQEQLINKDIPAFQELIGVDFKATLVKGRNNYICKKELLRLMENPESGAFHSLEETNEFNELVDEVTDKDGNIVKGDRSDIETKVSNGVWNKVTIESNACAGKKCPLYEECFFYKAKKENAEADIIVTNHAMFCADLKVQMDTDFQYDNLVLPHYDFLVFDEAHNLEDVASDFFGDELSRIGVRRFGTEMINQITKGDLASGITQDLSLQQDIVEQVNVLMDINDQFFKEVVAYSYDYQKQVPIAVKRVKQVPETFKTFIPVVRSTFDELDNLWLKVKDSCDFDEDELVVLKNIRKRLSDMRYIWISFLRQDLQDYVYWVETPDKATKSENKHFFASIHMSPVNVAQTLHDNLFERMDSVILTSATLGADNLNYMASRLGVGRYIGAMYHSPFNYEEQSRLYVPENSVNPKSQDYSEYVEEELKKVIKHSKGRTLVLFTSYYMLNNAYKNLKTYIEDELGYKLLKQGDMQRTPLINAFREDIDSVLFATSSYWEGIDVQGDALSSVVITRLPFEVPDQPVIEARMEFLQRIGKNPFMDYQVPLAIMKFKQGVGRLIRSTKDTGVVTILDNRVVTMHYGKKFLSSLPPMPMVRKEEDLKNFFK